MCLLNRLVLSSAAGGCGEAKATIQDGEGHCVIWELVVKCSLGLKNATHRVSFRNMQLGVFVA